MLLASLAGSPAAPAADQEHGRTLYEARCGGCHSQSVHGRDKRVAADFEAVRGWVRRWSANLGLAWNAEEVDDVAVHLNARYYRFRCPPDLCKATGLRDDGARRFALDDRSR
jgi:mono/diheme cytochrome c family protein